MSTVTGEESDAIIVRPQRWLATRAGLLSLFGIVTAFLVIIGAWTYRTVEGSLRDLRSDSMQGMLDAQVNSLRVWIAEELADAERIANDPAVRRAVLALVARAEVADPASTCASAERRQVNEVLRPMLADEGSAGHNVISASGRLLSTRYPDYCGLQVHPTRFKPLLDQVFLGKSRFVRPVRDTDRVALTPSVRAGGPLAWM